MDRTTARAIATHAEEAIASLSQALDVASKSASPEELAPIQRAIGLGIGQLSHELLDPIYAQFPDLAPPGVLDQPPPPK